MTLLGLDPKTAGIVDDTELVDGLWDSMCNTKGLCAFLALLLLLLAEPQPLVVAASVPALGNSTGLLEPSREGKGDDDAVREREVVVVVVSEPGAAKCTFLRI